MYIRIGYHSSLFSQYTNVQPTSATIPWGASGAQLQGCTASIVDGGRDAVKGTSLIRLCPWQSTSSFYSILTVLPLLMNQRRLDLLESVGFAPRYEYKISMSRVPVSVAAIASTLLGAAAASLMVGRCAMIESGP